MIKLDGLLTDTYYEIEGYKVRIRVEPPEFRKQLKDVSDLIDSKKYLEAITQIDKLPIEWRNDEEFVRLSTFISFMKENENV